MYKPEDPSKYVRGVWGAIVFLFTYLAFVGGTVYSILTIPQHPGKILLIGIMLGYSLKLSVELLLKVFWSDWKNLRKTRERERALLQEQG